MCNAPLNSSQTESLFGELAAPQNDFTPTNFKHNLIPNFTHPRNLLIHGLNGRGKTHLAAALAKKWNAKWLRPSRYLAELRSTYNNHSDQEELSLLKNYSNPKIFVLDDLTSPGQANHAALALLDLLRESYTAPLEMRATNKT